MAFGDIFRKLGLSQDELAERMNIPKKTLSGYECDRVDIKSSVIIELAKHLLTSPNYLLGYQEDPEIMEMAELFAQIKDEKIKKLLIKQIRAVADCSLM